MNCLLSYDVIHYDNPYMNLQHSWKFVIIAPIPIRFRP